MAMTWASPDHASEEVRGLDLLASAVSGPVERLVCERLGLEREPAATQVIPRDRHAELLEKKFISQSALDQAEGMPAESGGYGIHIARLVMDRLDYRRDAGWNILRMTKTVRVSATT